jgi:cytochrome c oxidase assembly protein subunit 15
MNPSTKNTIDSFRRISLITVIAVYFLILVGGIVRSTGSGMGCPDWPKCFGSVIPPTSVNQLPKNYQEIYLEKRMAKNERLVSMLQSLGFSEVAGQLANDKSILIEEEFNPVKTWIEYLNRLVGVVIGLLIVLTVWKSFALSKLDKWIPVNSVFALILVLFTGWIGSIVVSTNLLPWVITFHMLLALGLVALLIYIHHRSKILLESRDFDVSVPSKVRLILIFGLLLMVVQVILGTQVREQIDQISASLGNFLRDEWVDRVGLTFLIHRSFSLVLLLLHVGYFFLAFKHTSRKSRVNPWSQFLMAVLLLEIGTGIGMAYFGIPAYLQPVHLLLGSLIIGIQFVIILDLKGQLKLKTN